MALIGLFYVNQLRKKYLLKNVLNKSCYIWSIFSDSYGACPRATCFIGTKVFSKQKPLSTSTREISKKCTEFWKAFTSPSKTIPDFKYYGWRHIILRQKNLGEDPSVQWANIEYAENFPCRGPSGTARKRLIASKKNPARCFAIGTTTTPIPALVKSENLPKVQVWRRHKYQTGSKTGDKEIERLKETSKSNNLNKLHFNTMNVLI